MYNLKRELLHAAAGGLAGYFVFLLAGSIVIGVAVSHLFGGSLSIWENIVIFGLVPLLLIFGSSIPAWILGVAFWRGLLTGVIAMVAVVLILIFGNPNYSPFNDRETLQFVSAIFITALI